MKILNIYQILFLYGIIIALDLALNEKALAQIDIFGITQFYPTKQGSLEWNSLHWANGIDRTIKYASDPYDPTDWTEDHSATSPGFHIDGKGMMSMSGSPRFHINPLRNTKVSPQTFTNIEFTAYYRRKGLNGLNWGGMIVGMRGSALGHGSPGGNDCDALCYMARFRDDGKWDFEKELKHSGTTYYSGSGYMKQDPLWGGKILPENKWIGMKYILVNINNNTDVRLRVYIDSISNGNPVNGGVWQLVGDITDDGTNWQGADISGCSYTDKYMPILSGGNVFMRTDNDTAQYKMVSIREIDPFNGFGCSQPELGTDVTLCGVSSITLNSGIKTDGITTFEWFKNNVSQGLPSPTSNMKKISEAGIWKVVIDSSGKCSKQDSVAVMNTLPPVNLGTNMNLCNPSIITLDAGVSGQGINYTWSKDSYTIGGNTKTLTVTDPGIYAVTVHASSCIDQTDNINITSSLPKQNHDTICAAGTINPSVSGNGNYAWYDALSGGNLLGNGNTISQNISSNTTFYVEDVSSFKTNMGPKTAPCGGTTEGAERTDMQFIAYKDFTLESVNIMQANYGGTGTENFIVEIWTDNGSNAIGNLYATGKTNTLTKPTAGTRTEVTLQVSIEIKGSASGTKYWLQIKSSATAYYLNCTGSFPYKDDGTGGQIAQILKALHDGNATANFGMTYNWVLSSGTSCKRAIVYGIIDPLNAKCIVKVKEQDEKQSLFHFYLTPDKNELTIISTISVLKVEIISITGQSVVTLGANINCIDISQLTSESYILKATTAQGIITRKFIK